MHDTKKNDAYSATANLKAAALLVGFLALVPLSCTGRTQQAGSAQAGAKAVEALGPLGNDRLDFAVEPLRYTLELELDATTPDYRGRVQIDLRLHEKRAQLWLHSLEHLIESATLSDESGQKHPLQSARQKPDWLALSGDRDYEAGRYRLDIRFSGSMTKPLFGMYRAQDAKQWYIFTQMEPLGAREAFPCFDEPGFKTPFDVSLVVPTEQRAFFNSPRRALESLEDGRTRSIFATSKPLPTYLLAWAIGPLEFLHKSELDHRRPDGSTLPIRVITTRGQSHKAHLALAETSKLLQIQEEYFGTPYPYAKLDLVAVPDFEAGAMENPGLITYRDSLLLFEEENVTPSQLRSYAGTHAHELAHIWFGDWVTMQWWDDLWLNEAFATWFSAKTVARYRPDWNNEVDSIGWFTWVMEQDSNPRSRRIAEPIQTRGDIENAFDGITYGKGYAVLAMFEQWVGEQSFRDGVRDYLNGHAWGNATRDDLLRALQKSSGRPAFREAFNSFLTQAGVPLVHVEPQACEQGKTKVRLRQTRWQPLGGQALENHSWQIPICLKTDLKSEPACMLLDQPEDLMTIEGCPAVIRPNPGGTSYLLWSLPETWLEKLLVKLPQLPEIDRLSLIANLRMLYQSGALHIGELLRLGPTLLADPTPRVRLAALRLLEGLQRLLEKDELPAWEHYLASLASPLADELGWGDDEKNASRERWRLRGKVLTLAAKAKGGQNIVKEAQHRTALFLSGQKVRRELLSTTLQIAAKHGDVPLFETLQKRFEAERDPLVRRALRGALASFHQSTIYPRVLEYAFSKTLRANERSGFIWGPTRDPRSRDAAWTWIKARLEKVRTLLPGNDARYLPYILEGFCQKQRVQELRQTFAPWMPGGSAPPVDGLERHLVSVENRLERCLAQKEKHRATLLEFLQRP